MEQFPKIHCETLVVSWSKVIAWGNLSQKARKVHIAGLAVRSNTGYGGDGWNKNSSDYGVLFVLNTVYTG